MTTTAIAYNLDSETRDRNEQRQYSLLRSVFDPHDNCCTSGIHLVLTRDEPAQANARERVYQASVVLAVIGFALLAAQLNPFGALTYFIAFAVFGFGWAFMRPEAYATVHVHFDGNEPSHACVRPLRGPCTPFARSFADRLEAKTGLPVAVIAAPLYGETVCTDFRCERGRPRLI